MNAFADEVVADKGVSIEVAKFDAAKHNGMLSIQSIATGQWRTFSIRTARGGGMKGKRILSLLHGPNREDFTNWHGFAFVNDDGRVMLWKRYQDQPTYRTFADMIARPGFYQEKAIYRIEGRCRRCNRALTVPESVDSGYGPECRTKMGM